MKEGRKEGNEPASGFLANSRTHARTHVDRPVTMYRHANADDADAVLVVLAVAVVVAAAAAVVVVMVWGLPWKKSA